MDGDDPPTTSHETPQPPTVNSVQEAVICDGTMNHETPSHTTTEMDKHLSTGDSIRLEQATTEAPVNSELNCGNSTAEVLPTPPHVSAELEKASEPVSGDTAGVDTQLPATEENRNGESVSVTVSPSSEPPTEVVSKEEETVNLAVDETKQIGEDSTTVQTADQLDTKPIQEAKPEETECVQSTTHVVESAHIPPPRPPPPTTQPHSIKTTTGSISLPWHRHKAGTVAQGHSEEHKSLGSSMRGAWKNFRRSLRRKDRSKQPQQLSTVQITAPDMQVQVSSGGGLTHSEHELSLHSSEHFTPELSRKSPVAERQRQIAEAFNDFTQMEQPILNSNNLPHRVYIEYEKSSKNGEEEDQVLTNEDNTHIYANQSEMNEENMNDSVCRTVRTIVKTLPPNSDGDSDQIRSGEELTNPMAKRLAARVAAHEGVIQPVAVNRRPYKNTSEPAELSARQVAAVHSSGVGSACGSGVTLGKPPRPTSPPLLSPMDHHSFDLSTTSNSPELTQRRMNFMMALHPDEKESPKPVRPPRPLTEFKTVQRQRSSEIILPARPLTQVEQMSSLRSSTSDAQRSFTLQPIPKGARTTDYQPRSAQSTEVRRAHTMRTYTYSDRLRDRLQGYSVTIPDEPEVKGSTLKAQLAKGKPEMYVRSEVYSWPPKVLKLKRRKTTSPKVVVSGGGCGGAGGGGGVQQMKLSPTAANRSPMQLNTSPVHIEPSSYKLTSGVPMQINFDEEDEIEPARHLHQSARPLSVRAEMGVKQKMSPTSGAENDKIKTTLLQQSVRLSASKPNSPIIMAQRSKEHVAQGPGGAMMLTTTSSGQIQMMRGFDEIQLPHVSSRLMENSSFTGTGKQFHFDRSETDLTNQAHSEVFQVNPFLEDWQLIQPAEANEDNAPVIPESVHLFMKTCLENYLAASVNLRSGDILGEFAAFQWLATDMDETGWLRLRISNDEWKSLAIYYDPVRRLEFAKLHPIVLEPSSLIYADRSVDSLLTAWLDCRSTMVSPGLLQTNPTSNKSCDAVSSRAAYELLHPISMITTLDRLLKLGGNATKPTTDPLRIAVRLSVLLAYDYCMKSYQIDANSHLELDCRPEQMILLLAPCNWLVVFRLVHRPRRKPENEKVEENGTNVKGELSSEQNLAMLTYLGLGLDSIEAAIDACVKDLQEHALRCFETTTATTSTLLPSLLKALSPPDWLAMTVARVCLQKL